MLKHARKKVALMALSSLFVSCSRQAPPFLTARVCLPTRDDVAAFKALLEESAGRSGLQYFDRSSETSSELAATQTPTPAKRPDGFVLNAGALDREGRGVTAFHLNGPGYQVALGFSRGGSEHRADEFAGAFLSALRTKWSVRVQPGASPVQPAETCGPNN